MNGWILLTGGAVSGRACVCRLCSSLVSIYITFKSGIAAASEPIPWNREGLVNGLSTCWPQSVVFALTDGGFMVVLPELPFPFTKLGIGLLLLMAIPVDSW